MEDVTSSNAALMRRIVQLENERDDLRRDVEILCMQQSGQGTGGSDIFSRLQARRMSGLEQELESCRQKLLVYKRENENLQEELSEAYNIKGQFADLFKAEAEKNKKVEADIKFFQSQVASSLSERDRLLMDVEKAQIREDALEKKLEVANRRCEEYMRANEEKKNEINRANMDLEKLSYEVEVYLQVVRRFWSFKQQRHPCVENGSLEMAASLLADPEKLWTFGASDLQEKCQSLEVSNANLQEQVAAFKEKETQTKTQLDEQTSAKLEAFKEVSEMREKVGIASTRFTDELEDLKRSLREVQDLLRSEVASMGTLVQELAERCRFSENSARTTIEADKEDAFVQAMQEKVSALLLLSQQEERHVLERKSVGAYEIQIGELNTRLSQVTNEKVAALMEVAQLKFECQRLEDREKDLMKMLQNPNMTTGGRLLPAKWAKAGPQEAQDTVKPAPKETSTSTGYLRSWLPGRASNEASLYAAKFRVDTTVLHERVARLRQLMKEANRLNATLAKTLENHARQGEELKDDLVVLNKVFEEAQRLKLALKCTLPLSWNGGVEKLDESDDKSVLELVSVAGMALVEMLSMAVELHRKSLID